MGTLLLDEGDLAGARGALERGLAADPGLAEGWNALGVVRQRAGDAAGAKDAWDRAVRADPRYPDALFNLALACGQAGEYDRTRQMLRRYAGLVEGPERERALELLQRLGAAP
jgi:cytochrome c-type biogenesis protein CcmH/NrfG